MICLFLLPKAHDSKRVINAFRVAGKSADDRSNKMVKICPQLFKNVKIVKFC